MVGVSPRAEGEGWVVCTTSGPRAWANHHIIRTATSVVRGGRRRRALGARVERIRAWAKRDDGVWEGSAASSSSRDDRAALSPPVAPSPPFASLPPFPRAVSLRARSQRRRCRVLLAVRPLLSIAVAFRDRPVDNLSFKLASSLACTLAWLDLTCDLP